MGQAFDFRNQSVQAKIKIDPDNFHPLSVGRVG